MTNTPAAPPPSTPKAAPKAAMPKAQSRSVGFSTEITYVPPIWCINAVAGWGKTTTACYAENPAIIMVDGEKGYSKLASSGQVPVIPNLSVDEWDGLMSAIKGLQGPEYRTLIIDALQGVENLCYKYVATRDYGGEMSATGFFAYMQGPKAARMLLREFMAEIDRLNQTGVEIIFLGHPVVKAFNNPSGANYDRFTSDLEPANWQMLVKMMDVVLFGTYISDATAAATKKGEKANLSSDSGRDRCIYSEYRDAFEAKNKYKIPHFLTVTDPAKTWGQLKAYVGGPA